ncbi:toxin-activating lysine-acyltransferase [Serratia symbiotica]|uniref:toxin-activating lysine-acyltransferase n=1 Tax=Serratia symbiotica TaxID=138074 RepID=UPI00132717BE|nr:toxin-activating lysine-acyltransferase [Serratia symbiotica]MBF1995119.1 toxin-activating lysine-acyltransferase [Serratia symbiotica]MBQ0956328.1 toxin-activating lysine-acyltransferase [Serratia symbiotica]QTP15490.1 toxin-activating lysine-acyltransferase [Serratia symbiotica]
MQIGTYDVHAPLILGGDRSEAEVLGAAVWLWMHSSQHRDFPLYTLPTVLLPIIKHQHYMLVSLDANPLFFISWMWLNDQAEQRYLTSAEVQIREGDWASGNRLWIRDCIAPFGEIRAMSRLVTETLFPEHCFRSLYHRGAQRGKRVMNFKGAQVSHQQARAWRMAHPLSVSLPEYPQDRSRMLP